MSPARIPFGIDFPEINCSHNVARSSGIREIMLIVNTMEIPLPIPFSVIRSPIHIRTADPAVSVVMTIRIVKIPSSTRYPLLEKLIVIVMASNKPRPIVT